MRAPDFWRRGQGGVASALLSPLGALWGRATAARAARAPNWTAPVPVVCVGNVVVGGAGKTQVAIDLAHRLIQRDMNPHILLRGYGGQVAGPHRVDPATDSCVAVGDEALLAARAAPAWVGADRVASAKAAVASGADVLILDDGLQNPGLAKSLSLLVLDGDYGLGNGRCLPAGPLREPLSGALDRVQAVVRIGNGDAAFGTGDLPVFTAETVPAPTAPNLAGVKVIAFAGIGRPEKFFATLDAAGADIVAKHAFGDHHSYTTADIQPLIDSAYVEGVKLMTTEKDLVRVPLLLRHHIDAYPVTLQWSDETALSLFLTERVAP